MKMTRNCYFLYQEFNLKTKLSKTKRSILKKRSVCDMISKQHEYHTKEGNLTVLFDIMFIRNHCSTRYASS